MAPSTVHLPNGQGLTVTPVFGGLAFKPVEFGANRCAFPPGWTVVLNEEDENLDGVESNDAQITIDSATPNQFRRHIIHRYKRPSLSKDHMFISSISDPSNVSSPTRQVAMMVYATLYWYFHQPEPDARILNLDTSKTPEAGRPRGEWKININREGIFKKKNLLAKLERMGLVCVEDSSVGNGVEGLTNNETGSNMFVSRRAFWQMDARIYLFNLPPTTGSPFPGGSPFTSRPNSPAPEGYSTSNRDWPESINRASIAQIQGGPFVSSSHLPTYFPPHPQTFIFTNNIRHPRRPKPYRQGETIYTRFIPSFSQWLTFRIASLSDFAPSHQGPWTTYPAVGTSSARPSISDSILPTMASLGMGASDTELLHTWMNDPRVSEHWGCHGPKENQEKLLQTALSSRHSFPVIGCWDGKPFGYFEIYWVKEDHLGKYLGGECGDWDRGIHGLVGESEFRGPQRVKAWLSSLVHYCWLADMRTECIMMEPRVDNVKLLKYCQEAGFYKEREIAFPFKQANLLKMTRDSWEKPEI